MDKQIIKARQEAILALVKDFCTKELDEEHFELSAKLIAKLGRKRNVPFVSGKAEIWAAAVIHAIGSINFLFDKASKPYKTADDISVFFDTSKSTVAAKSKQIKDMLGLGYFDPEFSIRRVKDNNLFSKLAMFDGFVIRL